MAYNTTNIAKTVIDCKMLENELKYCEEYFNVRKSYIIMSLKTFNDLYKSKRCTIEFEPFSPEIDGLRGMRYSHILYNKEYPIFIDNSLEYGEVALL